MRNKFKASIIIPNFNGLMTLEKCLPKVIAASNMNQNKIIETILVDDASTDESVSFVRSKFPTVKVVRHKINRGFSSAVNTGVRSSKGNIIVLLNSDVAPSKNFLASALIHFSDPKVFAVSLHEEGYGWGGCRFEDGYLQLFEGKEAPNVQRSFYVSGGSGVFRRKIWTKLGGMDEKLFSPFYWEDVDICFRAAKRGYLNLWDPDAIVSHKHESTMEKLPKKYVDRIRERNQLLLIWKDIHSQRLMRKHFAGLVKRMLKHPGYTRIVAMALGKLGVVMERRRREIKLSKLSDETVLSRFSQ